MRRSICLLIVVLGAWSASLGQNAPKLTHPRIVATLERVGLTTPLATKTLYTPKEWGTFRVSIVMVGTVPNGKYNVAWQGNIGFMDSAGANEAEVDLATDRKRTAIGEFPIRAKGGQAITFSVTQVGNNLSGTKYNVWVVVEQLM